MTLFINKRTTTLSITLCDIHYISNTIVITRTFKWNVGLSIEQYCMARHNCTSPRLRHYDRHSK